MKNTAELTHYGRKSGKPYTMYVWFVRLDGRIWIGSLDDTRSWVKNVRAGEFELDTGDGPKRYRAVEVTDAEAEPFRKEILRQHPVRARLLFAFVRKTRCAFRCDPVA